MKSGVLICVALVSVPATMVRGEQELLIDPPPRRVEMTVEVRPDTASLGDTISIVISATNRDKETMRLYFPAGCPLSFRITGPNGRAVAVQRGCALADSVVLVAGGTVQDSFEVTLAVGDKLAAEPGFAVRGGRVFVPKGTIYDPSCIPPAAVTWPIEKDRIAPGVYRIEGGIRGQEFRWAADDLLVQ